MTEPLEAGREIRTGMVGAFEHDEAVRYLGFSRGTPEEYLLPRLMLTVKRLEERIAVLEAELHGAPVRPIPR